MTEQARRAVAGVLLAFALLVAVSPARAGASESGDLQLGTTDTRAYPELRTELAVSGPLAAQLLTADAFTVEVGGRQVETAVEAVPTRDLSIVLVLDTSGSMAGAPIDAARAAARAFLDRLPADVPVAIVGFGATPALVYGFGTDRAAAGAAIEQLRASGETALYDAVVRAVDVFDTAPAGRHAIVLLSDGGDTVSSGTLAQAVERVRATGTHLDAVPLQTPESAIPAIDDLVGAGGGRSVAAADPGALTSIYEQLASSLVNLYRLRFRTDAHGAADLRVTVRAGVATSTLTTPLTLPRRDPGAALRDPGDAPVTGLVVGAVAVFLALLVALLNLPERRRLGDQLARLGASGGGSPSKGVGELAGRAVAAAEGALERTDRRRGVEAALDAAGISLRAGEYVALGGVCALAGLLVGTLALGPLAAPVVAAAVAAGFKLHVDHRAAQRRERFTEQLPDTLHLLSGTLRAGYGLMQAVDAVAEEAESPTSDEFRRVVVETRLGRDLTESLQALADRMGGDDIAWVVQAIDINREIGGDLAQVLDTVGATIRERAQLRRQVRALSAEGRLSAYVLVALPVLLLFVMTLTNREYVAELTHGAGLVLSIAGAGLLGVGAVWLRRMCRLVY